MAKEPHKARREPTLALYVLQNINIFNLTSRFVEYYPEETDELSNLLTMLDQSEFANDVDSIIGLLETCEQKCQPFKQLSADDKATVQEFLNGLKSSLLLIRENMVASNINIDNALDAYTLIRTSAIIDSLKLLLSEKLKNTANLVSFFETSEGSSSHQDQTLAIAKQLISLCEQIRSQIGSPETMPKGLVINLMVHLLDATRDCQALTDTQNKLFKKLQSCIRREIKYLKTYFPELAQAGEDLQVAIANNQLKTQI